MPTRVTAQPPSGYSLILTLLILTLLRVDANTGYSSCLGVEQMLLHLMDA